MEPKNPVRLKIESWLSSAEQVGGDDNLLTQILLRLPARSIVRFKLVSWQWRYLITGTRFPPMHVRCNPKPPILGLYYSRGRHTYCISLEGHSLPTFTRTATPDSRMSQLRIHDSRHGLILCSSFSFFSWKPDQIFIWNPTTGKYITFHQRGLDLFGTEMIPVSHFYLYFDPSISPIYKLIWIRDQGDYYDVYFCPLKGSVWKNLYQETLPEWGRLLRYGVLSSDGIIYIMTDTWHLVKIDAKTEKLSIALTIFEPELLWDRVVEYIGERDVSSLVLIVSSVSEYDLLIYEMKKVDGQHWFMKYNINLWQELHNLQENYVLYDRSQFAVMWVFWKGENDMTLVLGVQGKLISYNLNRREVKEICALPGEDSIGSITNSDVRPFIASLCAVNV